MRATSVVHSELAIGSAASDPIGLLVPPPMVPVTLRLSSSMWHSLSVDCCTMERSPPLVRMIATGRAIGGNIGGNIVL